MQQKNNYIETNGINTLVRLMLCLFLFTLCFPSFSFGDNNTVTSKKLRVCQDNMLPINLNRVVGVALSKDKGSWLDEDGKTRSNVFVLPEDSEVKTYNFAYVVKEDNFYCGLKKGNKYEVAIEVVKKIQLNARAVQPSCANKQGEIIIENYNASLKYRVERDGVAVQTRANRLVGNLSTGYYSVTASDGFCSSAPVVLAVNSPVEDCLDCSDLWDNVSVDQLVSARDGNGVNDNLYIRGLVDFYKKACTDKVTLTVFNRWGTVVYEKENYMKDDDPERFDGHALKGLTFDSKSLPSGTYYYILSAEGVGAKTGFILLLTDKK